MSAFHTLELACPCGHKFDHILARGINIERAPELRQQILDGTFHTVKCPSCGKKRTVETAFSYTDPKKKMFIQVKPRKHFFHWREASQIIQDKVERLPSKHKIAGAQLRVVYGLAELREKLLCDDIKLDDRMLQLMKVILMYEHPFLLKRPRLQFILNSVNEDALVFRASHLHDNRHYEICVPLADVKKFKAMESKIRLKLKTTMKDNDIFDPKNGHFVSFTRFLPQTEALALLRKYARMVNQKIVFKPTSDEFQWMLKHLPRAAHLSSAAKNDLKTLNEFSKKNSLDKLQSQLTEVRFGKDLEHEFWKNKDGKDISTLWSVFEELPPNHIEGNSSVGEIHLKNLGDALGTYDPGNGEIDIHIDVLASRGDFEETIRHEVGHGVHKKQHKKINQWLFERFGWKIYECNFTGMNNWVKDMGGWQGETEKQKREIFRFFEKIFEANDGKERDEVARPKKGHPWYRKNFAPRHAFQNTREVWYENSDLWFRVGSRAYFLNYYYWTFCSVNIDTLKLVSKMNNYAAMSDKEFFAELYAFHFGGSAKAKKWVPKDVQKYLNEL